MILKMTVVVGKNNFIVSKRVYPREEDFTTFLRQEGEGGKYRGE